MRTNTVLGWMVGICLAVSYSAPAAEVGTAFTYQGLLEKPAGTLVDDTCDFTFRLFDAAAGGIEIEASPVGPVAINVVDGIFVASPDFGVDAITGVARWLEIAVQCPGDVSAITLTPRIELKPVPYALALPGLRTEQVGADEPNVIGGAQSNSVSLGVVGATIAGGASGNSVDADYGTVGGGYGCNAAGDYSTIGGGLGNATNGPYTTIGGGISNDTGLAYSTVAGGYQNLAGGQDAFVGGGAQNMATGSSSTIAGGFSNIASGLGSTVAGGSGNDVIAQYSTVGGGQINTVDSQYATIGGGSSNTNTDSTAATIGGGQANQIDLASWAVIAGGRSNSITTSSGSSVIGGGAENSITGSQATICGGYQNTASAGNATVGGGYHNTASGAGSTIAGGIENVAAGTVSFAAGGYAQANHSGAFVWNSSGIPFGSTASGQFLINAPGNVGIGTNSPSAKLHVDSPGGGGIHLSSNNLGDLRISFNNGGGTHYIFDDQSDSNSLAIETGLGNDFVVNTNGANNRMRITSGGLIGMARTPTTNRLEVEGNASKTTSGGWLANSDACIKEDVRTIKDALSVIDRLRPVAFRYTEEYKLQHPYVEDQDYYNFIAQEFAEVFPEAVSEDGAGILQMDSHPASIYAVAAIQELHSIVKDKERAIDDLRSQNDAELQLVIENDRAKDRKINELVRTNAELVKSNAALEARLARIEQLLHETARNGGK